MQNLDMKKCLEKIEKLAKPIVENLNYEFVDTSYEIIEGELFITVTIFNEKGITFEDCKKVSKALDEPLDELNPTNDQSYSLNVSSLGLDRPLKTIRDFERFLNKEIEVCSNKNTFVGTLIEILQDGIILKIKNTTKTIKFSYIDKAKPYIKF